VGIQRGEAFVHPALDAERSGAGVWYLVRHLGVEGWVHESFASLYPHKEQAERAAGELR